MLSSRSPLRVNSSSQHATLAMRSPTLPLLSAAASRLAVGCSQVYRTGAISIISGSNRTSSRRHPVVTASSSQHDFVSAPDTVSFARLPISQQSISMAFQVLDKDEDGRISRSEACRLVAYYLALQQHTPTQSSARHRPLTWDQHLVSSIATARKLSGGSWAGVAAACEAFVGAKVAGGLQTHPPRCSDLVWAAAGMAAAVLALGLLAGAAKTLPVVGQWHQQGLPLLLGSFGTLAILLFGKPEAEPVRLWNVIAGQLGGTVIAMAVLQCWGANLASRAAAMAATCAWMMWADCIHPPGGALVLMAMDNAAIQQMSWAYCLYPSLALSLAVLLPISAATNWLRRNYVFDAPLLTTHGSGAATLRQKVREWQQQQAAKQAAVVRQYRALELDRAGAVVAGAGGQLVLLHEELHSPVARLRRVFGPLLGPILQLLSFPQRVLRGSGSQQKKKKQQHQQRRPRGWGGVTLTAGGRKLQVRGVCLDLGTFSLGGDGSNSTAADAEATAAAAAALEAAIRRRLMQDEERRYEDNLHRRHMWGGADQVPDDVRKALEDKAALWRRQQPPQQQPSSPSSSTAAGASGADSSGNTPQQPQLQSGGLEEAGSLPTPRQRLEQYWALKAADAQMTDAIAGRSRSVSPPTHQQRGPLDSFAPDEE